MVALNFYFLLTFFRFCIVSHLEEENKCFYCDSTTEWRPYRDPYRLSHRIENVVSDGYEDKYRSWWQSENGVQNVTVQLDLEAEFHFTHLIMTFKSFRPAAMVIERSADEGKTWQVYRYFAYDCAGTFPGIPEGPPKKHTDVICTRAYSDVAPSTGGELVYKVISPHIATENPYADEIASLLKITNLRFNFTKLHTLGDDLLDYRPEIDEKYYYAIYEIVVRGSCSCYGHASRCIPIENNNDPALSRSDIVHGRCECMHNTDGLNCKVCRDFYHDLPWRPATGENKNECRMCECNGHATRCHFDRAVYQASGFQSGGVCDDCQHNTQGKNCEQCKPFFYRDPQRAITDPYVCVPCTCDKSGSQDDGICEGEEDPERGLVAGKCYCKSNVDGPRCDRCKNGFWNLQSSNPDGCVPCHCHLLGTFNNEGCDKTTGNCTCKRLVTGENCDQCLPEHYGLSENVDGCQPCDCDIGGSINNVCDFVTGQCVCREGFSGRRCDTAESSFYCADIDHFTYEAENAILTNVCLYIDTNVIYLHMNIFKAEIEHREARNDDVANTWSGEGFVRVSERSSIIFKIDNIKISQKYNIILRYDIGRDQVGWENVQLTIVRVNELSGECKDSDPSDDFLIARFNPGGRYVEVYPAVCLESNSQYEIHVLFGEKRSGIQDRNAWMLIDSLVLAPPTDSLVIFKGSGRALQHKTEYDRHQCRNFVLSLTPRNLLSETCERYICPVAAAILNSTSVCDCDPTGSVSGICSVKGGQCECKPNVIGRRCDKCAVGTYGFGRTGCVECACDSVGSLHNRCDKQSGQCVCREKGIYGRQCNQCQPGFWSFPDCRVCQCNDHANICDQQTGSCIECRDLTAGHYCDRCQDGYYGDPRLGVGLPCKPCPCPGGPTSGFQHADTCYLQLSNNTQDVVCNCRSGYTGERCAECALNYWGNPTEVGGSCEQCDCNGNIDMTVEGSCDPATGECLKCLHNTDGPMCENCIDGYYGDAKIRSCQRSIKTYLIVNKKWGIFRCVCNRLGSNLTSATCDRITGQCPCRANVIGKQCDQCAENHYDLSGDKGCSPCNCDPSGVVTNQDGSPELQCNQFDGKCHCKIGRGGRTCTECEDYFWGDPTTNEGCKRCECNPVGSANQQCHRNNGTCICLPGSGGDLCNECARGYTGTWPFCKPCGECFHQWDSIIHELRKEVDKLVETTNNIEDTGIVSAYDDEFEKMEKLLEETKKKLSDANISKEHLEQLDAEAAKLKKEVTVAREKLDSIEVRVSNATQAVDFAQEDLKQLQADALRLTQAADDLRERTNKIKEADVQGAYNITKESASRSLTAQHRTDAAVAKLAGAESEAREAESLLEKNRDDFDKQYSENEAALVESERKLNLLEAALPQLNAEVCGAASAPCDDLCGGPGKCGFCGGQSCLEGAVSKADQARSFSLEADLKLNEKQKEAEEVLSLVRDALHITAVAKKNALVALEAAQNAALSTNLSRMNLDKIVDQMNDFLKSPRSSPEQIRFLAEEVLNKKISLTPEQVTALTTKIRNSLAKINNIGAILAETRGNKTLASNLEAKALAASARAGAIKNTTDMVREAIEIAEETQEHVDAAKRETDATETRAKEVNSSLSNLEAEMKKVKVQYLQIADDAKNAFNLVDKALHAAKTAEYGNKQMEMDIKEAKRLLSERTLGNEDPQKRAELLRQRASKLLYKAQRSSDDISVLTKDASDVRLDEYQRTLDELNSRLERVTKDIHASTEFFANCDV
ncbi:laminin EGF-like protein [Dictyocaulus viviparus]|uniref:Laminin EGF-like protein n=1 Tax=Dictyocaulus viviparus TaxID=29172 RepID=A0A0D8XX57_DICVI|nr:laminin EGF-like protein [Dictyocaulus viviparus]